MAYEDFAAEFMAELAKQMEKDQAILTSREIAKTNRTRDGIIITCPGKKESPVIYLDDAWQMRLDGYSVAETAQWAVQSLRNIPDDIPAISEINAANARHNLYCAVVNAEANQDLLDHCVYEKLEDLAVIARYRMGANASMAVTDDMCSCLLHMTSSEVMEIAKANTERQEYQCINLSEMISGLMRQAGLPDEYEEERSLSQPQAYVVTNTSMVDGAAAVTSEKAMQLAHDTLGEDFYILPSSRHEIIVIAESDVQNPEFLEGMVRDINRAEVAATDRLSDHIYRYDSTRRRVNLVDTHVLSTDDTLSRTDTRKQYRHH